MRYIYKLYLSDHSIQMTVHYIFVCKQQYDQSNNKKNIYDTVLLPTYL